ncbi:hypothetical protein [Jannaschia sp. W003]|uniref:hypothetical protein n=1 Tax=Jannaschia sp. W003 TaxID=2867012 RepID=UPI0021A7390B|nr:hypothetical protein [Jannaschia sp. W003]UWQ21760.1 hypothetical protein K3554_01635 [Jannaschia sp. W003]
MTDASRPLDDEWIDAARARFRAFADGLDGPPLILSHDDADGLSSGALLARAFARRGAMPDVRLVGRGRNAWSDATAAEVAEAKAPGLVVSDLGMRGRVLHSRMAVVDHHVPTGTPEGACVVHGYGLDPTPSSSLLAWWCAQGLGEADDLLWLAAVGLIGDLGDKAPFDAIPLAKKRFGAGKLRELTTLVNAPRRSASGDGTPALRLLLAADDPADALSGRHEGLEACQAAREEVKAALAEARRQPPRFGSRYGGTVAMVRIDSPCQVHPVVAQSWVGRLKADFVLAANFGYLPGQVAMSGRARGDADLVAFLRRHRPEGADPLLYGNGHRRAAGGTLGPEAWNALVEDLGFGPEMRA